MTLTMQPLGVLNFTFRHWGIGRRREIIIGSNSCSISCCSRCPCWRGSGWCSADTRGTTTGKRKQGAGARTQNRSESARTENKTQPFPKLVSAGSSRIELRTELARSQKTRPVNGAVGIAAGRCPTAENNRKYLSACLTLPGRDFHRSLNAHSAPGTLPEINRQGYRPTSHRAHCLCKQQTYCGNWL